MKRPSFVTRFLLFCSGASLDIISKCPGFEKIKYASIGATIFFTSILALVSGLYALTLITTSLPIKILGAIFWALIIFNLDRYIVMSLRPNESTFHNLFISLPRLIIACLVAVVISKPIEVKLLENDIDVFLDKQKIDNLYGVDKKYESDIRFVDSLKNQIDVDFDKKIALSNKYYEDYMCECNGTCGTLLRGRGVECKTRKEKYENYLLYLGQEKIIRDSLLQTVISKENQVQELINSEKQILKSYQFGFFDKVKALKQVDNISSNFILLLFIMIETAPIFTKLLSKRGPYDSLVLKAEYDFETDYLKSASSHDIQREKVYELNKINAELAIKSEKNKIKNIDRQSAFERYENIREQLKNNKS